MKVKIYDNWTIDPDQSELTCPKSRVQEPPCWAGDNTVVAGRGQEEVATVAVARGILRKFRTVAIHHSLIT